MVETSALEPWFSCALCRFSPIEKQWTLRWGVIDEVLEGSAMLMKGPRGQETSEQCGIEHRASHDSASRDGPE